ncbi:hypothetical protein U0070_009012 [Myodes glareolus]|uniref:Uncharacterized protein n=1 Tax=Myodes glareolus TaxID=447135 RepID=A0AAW0JPL2_MYOGA
MSIDKGVVDTQMEGESSHPSVDIFKAIFASSSDEQSSSSEKEQDDSEDNQEHTEEASFKRSQEADAGETPVTHAAEPEPCEPTAPFPIQKVPMDEREEFRLRLPPIFCPNTHQKLETPPKEKPKKSKEKHKTKKEHR